MKKSIWIYVTYLMISIFIDELFGVRFHGTQETLGKIIEIVSAQTKGAYLRFGDGDANLAIGAHDALQRAGHSLMLEMQEAFALQGSTVLKTLPLHCKEFNGCEPGMFPGNHAAPYDWCLNILNKARPLWKAKIEDVYSPVALHFAASHHPDLCIQFLKFLKQSRCHMLIGNANIPDHIRELLFGPDCIFVPTPPQQSYNAIDSIEAECLRHMGDTSDYRIIVTAMGCSGRVLQKRLWNKLDNVFLFDFGSVMDALCGWNTRAWIELTKFDEEAFITKLKAELQS